MLGAILYDGISALISNAALRVALQNGLFLLTFLSMRIGLRALAQLPDLREEAAAGHSFMRPGFQALMRALREVLAWPAFFFRMWLLCLTSAASLFAVYVVQSPLSRLAHQLAAQSPKWWPLYTVIVAFGYWASSRGSRAWRAYHQRRSDAEVSSTDQSTAALWLAIGSLLLLALYPLVYAVRAQLADTRWPLLVCAAIMCMLFNYLRGFVEPYSATALIAFTKEKGLLVPTSLVSVFNSLKRGVHFGLSALFFVLLQRAATSTDGPDAILSTTLLWVCVAFGALIMPAAWSIWRKTKPASTAHRA